MPVSVLPVAIAPATSAIFSVKATAVAVVVSIF